MKYYAAIDTNVKDSVFSSFPINPVSPFAVLLFPYPFYRKWIFSEYNHPN